MAATLVDKAQLLQLELNQHHPKDYSLVDSIMQRSKSSVNPDNVLLDFPTVVNTIFIRARDFLTPTILRRSFNHPELRDGANGALDGLRGISCAVVATFHWWDEFYECNSGFFWYGDIPGGGPSATMLNLPIVKTLYNGPAMVSIFFVISGYVLSHRFLCSINKGRIQEALSALPSAIFRRWFRLFAPVGVAFAATSVLLWLGIFEYARTNDTGPRPFPTREASAFKQYMLWQDTWAHVVASFNWDKFGPSQLDSNAWTISIEYRCSMVVFLALAGLATVKPTMRLLLLGLMMCWALVYHQVWEVVLFLGGVFIAQWNIMQEQGPGILCTQHSPDVQRLRSKAWWTALAGAFYLCSIPHIRFDEAGNTALGWDGLERINPIDGSYIFNTWAVIGAFLMVATTTNLVPLQRVLNTDLPQYAGQLSYALYLTHGPLLKVLGWTIVPNLYEILIMYMESENAAYHLSCGIGFAVFVPCTVVVADVFMRYVDIPCTKLSKKLLVACAQEA